MLSFQIYMAALCALPGYTVKSCESVFSRIVTNTTSLFNRCFLQTFAPKMFCATWSLGPQAMFRPSDFSFSTS